MKTLVLTGCSTGMAEVHALTVESKRKWAERHGYDFLEIRQWDPKPAIVWQKMQWIERMLRSYGEVVWLDADSIITNSEYTTRALTRWPERKNVAVYASADWGPCNPSDEWFWFNTGNMVVHAWPHTQELLSEMFAIGREHWWETWAFEQSALQTLKQDARWTDAICVLAGRVLNAVPTIVHPESRNPWDSACFLAHITGVSNERRIEILKGGLQS